jgi:hypothetical protein
MAWTVAQLLAALAGAIRRLMADPRYRSWVISAGVCICVLVLEAAFLHATHVTWRQTREMLYGSSASPASPAWLVSRVGSQVALVRWPFWLLPAAGLALGAHQRDGAAVR